MIPLSYEFTYIEVDNRRSMRILLSIDTDKNIKGLSSRLAKILNMFDEGIFYVDLLHVYRKPEADAPHLPQTMTEIVDDERKVRMNFMSNCQHIVDKLLHNKLHKSALVNSYLKEGKYVPEVVDHLRFHKYDFIVLLPGEKSNLSLLMKRCNVNKLMKKTDIPMLILPKEKAFEFKSTAFVAMLENIKKDQKDVSKYKFFKKLHNGGMKYLHIGKREEGTEENLFVFEADDRVEGYKAYHNDRDKNHIYILNHKRKKGMKRILNSSFTQAVLARQDASLMIL